MTQSYWTNSSVLRLAENRNPIDVITQNARNLILKFLESGATGPPFDPFKLADFLKLQTVPSENVRDARTVYHNGKFFIEFNPNRPRGRVRYSVSHEIVHTLFPDCKDEIRNRATHEDMQKDEWQLEMLCNIGASEILMPIGSFPQLKIEKLSIDNLLELRKEFDVSVEALLLRFIKLTQHQCAIFASSRINPDKSQYKIDYAISSQSMPIQIPSGLKLPNSSLVSDCTAIGFTAKGHEKWNIELESVKVECIGIPAYPNQTYPRVMGLIQPMKRLETEARSNKPNLVKGDATKPRGEGEKIIAFVVNDTTPRWGAGFALTVRKKWSFIQDNFIKWAENNPRKFNLGNIHIIPLDFHTNCVTLICQHGYGASPKPRIRYSALKECLEKLATVAKEKGASIHMPKIGSGQAAGNWSIILEMIGETLTSQGLDVTIYEFFDKKPKKGQQLQLVYSSGVDY